MATAETLAELRAREEELDREWTWLATALDTVARVKAEQGQTAAFRLMQRQAVRVGQRRVEVRLAMAALESDGR